MTASRQSQTSGGSAGGSEQIVLAQFTACSTLLGGVPCTGFVGSTFTSAQAPPSSGLMQNLYSVGLPGRSGAAAFQSEPDFVIGRPRAHDSGASQSPRSST